MTKIPMGKLSKALLGHEDPTAQEKSFGALIGGRRRGGSGANANAKGDVISRRYLGECKQTKNKSYPLSIHVLSKIWTEAMAEQKTPIVHVHFQGEMHAGVPRSWVVMTEDEFKRLKGEQ